MDPKEESIYVYDVTHTITFDATNDAEANQLLSRYIDNLDDIAYVTRTEAKLVTVVAPDGSVVFRTVQRLIPFEND